MEIEAGVKVYGGAIKVFGNLVVSGTQNAHVIFDNVAIIPGNGGSNVPFSISIDSAEILGGSVYSPTGNAVYGSISITNSTIKNIPYIYLWYPVSDCNFEKNVFINSGGISVGTSGNVKVDIKNNVFYSPSSFAIENWASYGTSETNVSYNSFLNVSNLAVRLPAGYADAKMHAENNFWDTLTKSEIEALIFDKNDDLSVNNIIPFEPFLLAPDQNTPQYSY